MSRSSIAQLSSLSIIIVAATLAGLARAEDDKTLVFETAPKEWKALEAKGAMAPKASYELPAAEGDKDPAKVTVHFFGNGMGGTVDDNVARWCKQFTDKSGETLDPKTVKKEKSEVNGLKVTYLELSGTYQPPSFMGPKQDAKPGYVMLAAIVESPSGLWFVRFVGPEKTGAKHKDAYLKWLKSARWAEPGSKPEEKKDEPKKDDTKKDEPKKDDDKK